MKKLKTVWVIDDDDIHQFFAKKSIEQFSSGSCISAFSNGQAALSDFKRLLLTPDLLPDIIFLDINMPEMDGWEMMDQLCELLPRQPRKINIFIVSSSISTSDRERAKSYAQITGFLIKPIIPNILADILGGSQ